MDLNPTLSLFLVVSCSAQVDRSGVLLHKYTRQRYLTVWGGGGAYSPFEVQPFPDQYTLELNLNFWL
jgi:hypothetical protein